MECHQEFKWDFIAGMPEEEGEKSGICWQSKRFSAISVSDENMGSLGKGTGPERKERE